MLQWLLDRRTGQARGDVPTGTPRSELQSPEQWGFCQSSTQETMLEIAKSADVAAICTRDNFINDVFLATDCFSDCGRDCFCSCGFGSELQEQKVDVGGSISLRVI